MSGLIDTTGGLRFGAGLQFQTKIGTAGLDIVTFSPKNFPGFTLWFDGSDASTITFGTAPAIATWADKSGNANNATQATAANRPTQDSAVQNGLNAVKFVSASSQKFTLTSPFSLTSGYTAFMVGKRASTANQMTFLGSSSASGSHAPIWFTDSSIYASGTSAVAISNSEAVTTFNLICVGQNALETHGFVRFNEVDITSANAASAPMTGMDSIGFEVGNGFSDGDIAEYLLYTSVFTLSQIQQVEAYLKGKWATP